MNKDSAAYDAAENMKTDGLTQRDWLESDSRRNFGSLLVRRRSGRRRRPRHPRLSKGKVGLTQAAAFTHQMFVEHLPARHSSRGRGYGSEPAGQTPAFLELVF